MFTLAIFNRMAKIRSPENPNCWWRFGATGTLIPCWWECKTLQTLCKVVWQVLTKLNLLFPGNPAIALLGICPTEQKAYIQTKTCTCMFIATLFIIVQLWRQPRWPSIGEWKNQLWSFKTMEYSSALKINEPGGPMVKNPSYSAGHKGYIPDLRKCHMPWGN